MTRTAVIYIVSGPSFIAEAQISAKSINGKYPVILCTPDTGSFAGFDWIIELPARRHRYWFYDCTHYANIALERLSGDFDRLLLLDSDTYVCGDLADFFTILDRFDIAGTQAVARETQVKRNDIPLSFPELHIGAVSFRTNDRVRVLFQRWYEIYGSNPAYWDNNDQGPLREALWYDDDIRLAILPQEFCFRYRWGGLISGPVRVLHGRENNTPYEKIVKALGKGGIRVYGRRELA